YGRPGRARSGMAARACGARLDLVAEFVLPLLPAGQFLVLAGAGVGEPVGAHGHGHLRIVGALDHRLGVAVPVQHQGGVGVPGGQPRVAPPVAALVVVHVPGDHGVVRVAGVVVLGVDLHPVPVRVAQVEVERVGDSVPAGASFDAVAAAQRPELVADGQDVVLFVGGEGDVVHPRAVAAGHRGVVHGGLAAHPGGVDGAGVVADVLGDPEAQVLHVLHRFGHVR